MDLARDFGRTMKMHVSTLGTAALLGAAFVVACNGNEQPRGGQTPTGGASDGCSKSGSPTGVQNSQSIDVGGRSRTYVLSVPTSYVSSSPLPLIFAWHGLGGSGTMARQYFGIESASGGQAIFVYPDGLASGDAGAGWDLASDGIDVALFDALVTHISSNYCVDPNRIFSTGHSFGAMFTNALGCYRGDPLRAIAPVAGGPPGYGRQVTCTGQVAAWIAHGQNDPTVQFSQGVASRDFWIGRNGCSTTETVTWDPQPACVAYQGCQADLPVIWCVHDEGHNWPNTRYGCDGGVCFDAGPAIWSFFASFR